MVIDEKNSHINSFTKGMNSDTTYDLIPNENYSFAKNVRITKNYLIGSTNTESLSLREGIITPVYNGLILDNQWDINKSTVLSVDSIDDIGIVVCKNEQTDSLLVYKFILQKENDSEKDKILWFKKWWESESGLASGINSVSTVLYRELDNVIKLYIATGVYPIITLRVDGNEPYYKNKLSVDYVINNRIFPTSPVYIADKIGGQLHTSQVLYTYRFYNKYGITTLLAPLTNKIQVIDVNRDKELGNAEDTVTSVGFSLRINTQTDDNKSYLDIYDRIQVYRLLYIKPNEDAHVSLIYDDKLTTNEQNKFILNDVGLEALQSLTMEEFAAMSGMIIIPKVIEKNLDYMFAANVKDDTIIKDLVIDKNSYSIQQIKFDVLLDLGYLGDKVFSKPVVNTDDINTPVSQDILTYIKSRNVNPDLVRNTYDNIFMSSLVRSLRRGETYKYGIVFYDKYGRRSDVLSLDDVSVEKIDLNTNPTFVVDNDGKVNAKPVGVKIKIPTPKVNGNVPDYLVGCLIVRRSSKDIYQKTLLLVALARPIRQALYGTTIEDKSEQAITDFPKEQSPYYPFGLLTTNSGFIYPGYYALICGEYEGNVFFSANATDNHNLFLIFSSEIDVRRDDVLSRLGSDNISIEKLYIAYPKIKNDSTIEHTNKNNQKDDPYLYEVNKNIYDQLKYENDLQPFAISPSFNYYIKNRLLSLPELKYLYNMSSGIITCPGTWDIYKNAGALMYNSYMTAMTSYYPKSSIDPKYDLGVILSSKEKNTDNIIFNYYNYSKDADFGQDSPKLIKSIKDVKIPKWYEGFSNLLYDGADIVGGVKQYKSYTTSVGEFKYNNWNSFGCYDLKLYQEDLPNVNEDLSAFLYRGTWTSRRSQDSNNAADRLWKARSFIGPGPSCMLISIEDDGETIESNLKRYYLDSQQSLATHICNITHPAQQSNIESDEQVQYFGFGNFFKLKYKKNTNNYVAITSDEGTESEYVTVFDGDIYITPHEILTMYKSYDFNSKDSLQSMLIVNYIPLESKINTYFDYGANYLNTESANILYDGGSIEGITSQERPAHQYNMIYANNDVSNDVFNIITTDSNETNNFPYRTYYSEPKINGEFVDNFNIFKPASFIDVDNKYGEVTELLTDKNSLYYWQNTAFGKFSVNERSLINDLNGNTIMLGLAGILSRYDYINTKYGMRPYDYCAIASDSGIYWVDINNKAVVAANNLQAINYSELTNVLNILNNNISTDIPRVDYDVLNNELVCKCLINGEQLVFNTKHNIATSIYNRDYLDIVYIYNHMYGLKLNSLSNLQFTKYNYLTSNDAKYMQYLTPLQVEFIVNPAASTTKVYDSQTIIPLKRTKYNGTETDPIETEYLNNVHTLFETDIISTNDNKIEGHTDREGNIIYNIPRYGNEQYGNRMRGKWMRTFIHKDIPDGFFTISHAITKLRLSYS